ncbi:rubrerythrin [Patescibacteria group bacterium]
MKKTQQNLVKAFIGESMARNKYTFFAQKAREEGYEWIARVFEETADNERAHAEREYQFLREKTVTSGDFDLGPTGSTVENLKTAAAGEHYEWGEMYPEFEKQAKEENQQAVAIVFKEISEVEEKHEERYLKLAGLLEKGELYKAKEKSSWKCLNCGYLHKGKSAPATCPACGKPQGYYQRLGLHQ